MQNDKEFKSKIIKFRSDISESEVYDDDYDEFEDWEVDYDLLEKKDYQALLQYRKRRAERYPEDSDVLYFLGEAYVLNGEFEKAIQLLSAHHKDEPDNPNFIYVILDALFAIEKNENDLLKAIAEDKRFIVNNPKEGPFAEVKVARKSAKPKQ